MGETGQRTAPSKKRQVRVKTSKCGLDKIGPSVVFPSADHAGPPGEVREIWMWPDLLNGVDTGPKRHQTDDVCDGETMSE